MTWDNMVTVAKATIHWGPEGFQVTDHPGGYPALTDMYNPPAFPKYVLPNPHRQIKKWLGSDRAERLLAHKIMGRVKVERDATAADVMTAIQEEITMTLVDIADDDEAKRACKPWFGKRLTWKDAK